MKRHLIWIILSVCILALPTMPTYSSEKGSAKKPAPEDCLKMLKEGNARFVAGKSLHPHSDTARVKQAGSENQKDHACMPRFCPARTLACLWNLSSTRGLWTSL